MKPDLMIVSEVWTEEKTAERRLAAKHKAVRLQRQAKAFKAKQRKLKVKNDRLRKS